LAIDAIGVTGVLVLSVAFQAVGTMFMTLTRTRSTGESTPRHGMARSMLDGLVYIYTNRMISIFILLVAFHCALVMSYDSVLPVFTRNELGAVDGSTLGYLVMGFGLGSLFATVLIAGVRGERNKGRWLLWTGVVSGIIPIVLAFSPNVAPAVVISAVMGGAQSVFMALTTTYVQTLAPDRLRGRISSLYILHAGGIMAFANLGYGFIADVFSAPPILYATGAVFLVFIFAANVSLPDLRRVYRTGQAVAA
jgi:MFS family permease